MAGKKSAKSALPKLPRFSPTRIELYRFCPRAYHFYYEEGLRWGGMNAGFAVGGNLHRTLQLIHDRGAQQNVSLDELLTQLRDGWSQAGFSSPEEAAAHLSAGEAMLTQYYHSTPDVERETVWTEKTVQHRYNEFVLFGKIDRLDRRADGALEVVDYKSGRLTVSEEEVRASLALTVYQLLIARNHPGVEVYVGILCLRSAVHVAIHRTEVELMEAEHEIINLVRAILEDEEKAALPGPQCRNCQYPRICGPGRQWLWQHPEAG
jgi:putative RecB family exonuclease